ncbi:Hypothetical protein CINCED_3A007241 [Cinara cedri]|nr:Hypothetical protein CINCED_3A007241 [Cinara cedri]
MYETDEVNEIKYKYQEEKRTNEELKERIMRLQKNMITSSISQKNQSLNKKGHNRRRTWGGKLENTFSSSNILATIEEDVNLPRPSVPSNFEFKTPLESFEWDLIREEDQKIDNESLNNENTSYDFSPPASIPLNVCETPKKVLRERVNNYKNMFEMSMKENNELREFTTLEKQMFHDNNEQLKDLSNLRKKIDDLQNEKNESAKIIEKLKSSVKLIENEKRDVEITMEIQKQKFEKREAELLTSIQETREELKFKDDQLKKVIFSNDFMAQNQEEIKRLEMKIKEMCILNNSYISEIEMLKTQLLMKDQLLNVELTNNNSLINELSSLQNEVAEVKSLPYAIKLVADEGYFTLKKIEIEELYRLFESIQNTVDQLQQGNLSITDENNNLKLIIDDYKHQMNNAKEENNNLKVIIDDYNHQINNAVKENNELKSQSNLIEINIKSIIKEFSACNEIDVDNSEISSLLNFAAKHFEQNTDQNEKLSNENLILNEKLSFSNNNLCKIKSLVFDNLDNILTIISTMEVKSMCEIEKFKKDLTESLKENIILKSCIQMFDELTLECVKIIEQVKTNQSNMVYLQEELTVCNALKNEFQSDIENIKQKIEIQKQAEVELVTNDLQNSLDELKEMKMKVQLNLSEFDELNTLLHSKNSELDKNSKLIIDLESDRLELNKKLKELSFSENKTREELLTVNKELDDIQIKNNSNITIIENLKDELDTIRFELEEKSNIVNKSEVTMCNYLKEINTLNNYNIKLQMELEEKSKKENDLKYELHIVTKEIEDAILKTNEVKAVYNILNSKCESKTLIVEQLNYELKCINSTLNEKNNLIVELENTNLALLTKCENLEVIDQLNKTIVELQMKLEDKTQIENEMHNELQAKIMQLENASVKENELQGLVESMKNEEELNIISVKKIESELVTKSNLLTNLEIINSELLLKFNEINETNLFNMNEHKKIQDQLQTVIQEKALIQTDLNLLTVQLLEKTDHHDQIKKHLEDTLQQQAFNYQKLYNEFMHFSSDIELILNLQINTESKLRAEILYKSTELDDLQKQLYESNLQQDYEKLEEEYILRTRECDEAFAKIKNLESILLTKEESEKVLKDNFKSKCIALEEYKKNVEFLFMKNDSFQMRVNDFEDNVLVDLNEEFDSMKSELTKRIESEKILVEEKLKLECNLNELQEKLVSTSKALELSEEQSKELASIIDIFVFEIKEANSAKENLEFRLNQAEHELLKSGDYTQSLECELYNLQTKLENECIKAECVEKEFIELKLKCNDQINKKDLEGLDVRNKIIDSLVDYVHDIKLKLTELNSAMISGNQCEKDLRTKVMSVEDDILPLDGTLKASCNPSFESADIGIGLEINNLRKLLEDKINLVKDLQNSKNDMEINISKLQDQINKQSVENNKLINDMTLMENDLKEKTSTVNNLSNELNTIKIQYNELEEHNQAIKEQIHFSFDIDTELRNGKKDLVNEINLLEPGKITGVLTHHNLSNLLVTFVNLIMTKEQQIVADLVHNQNKIKQQYEEQIRQFEEDIKKEKEWQEQVESDNEKLSLELENLKSEKHNFPCKEIEIKELTEKLLEAENQSFNYLCELQELKTLFSKENEQNYKSLSNEFEIFKINSEQSIQNLKNKLEDLTHKYNESLNMYKDQTNSRSTLEDQIEKLTSECTCLKAIIEKKDEDIKNLFEKVQLKTLEYEALIEKNNLLKDEMKEVHGKKIDELQLELNDKIQQIYRTEKLLKEVTKNHQQLIEEMSLNVLQTKHQQENDNSAINLNLNENDFFKLSELLKCTGTLPVIYDNISLLVVKCGHLEEEIKELKHANVNLDNECEAMLIEIKNKDNKIIELLTSEDEIRQTIELLTEEKEVLKNKCEQLKNVNSNVKKLNDEICGYEQNIYQLRKEKGQLIVQHDKEINQLKTELKQAQTKNQEILNEYNKLSETAKNLEKSLKEDIQQLNRCIVDKNAKISTLELFSKTNADELKKKNRELEYVYKRARDENHMLRKELRHIKEITHVTKVDQHTQTVEEQSMVGSAMLAGHKSMTEKITKLESDNYLMKKMLHHRKTKIENLQKQLEERHS